jgi:hypothetical protein
MERRAHPAGATRNRGPGVKRVSGAISAVMRRALAGMWPYSARNGCHADLPTVIIAHIAIYLVTTLALRYSRPQTLPQTRTLPPSPLHLYQPRLHAGNRVSHTSKWYPS